MRNFKPVLHAFLGAAAIATLVAACEDEHPPKQIATVATPAPASSKPEARVETPAPPKPTVEVAKKTEAPKSEPAATSDDGSVDELLARARDAINKGELDHALKLARLATKKAPAKSAAFNTLGRAQLKAGARKDAIASFQKAVELNPSSSFAENNLGLALIYDGKYEE